VNLDGVWGSIFSFAGGRFLWKFPRRIPYPVRVTFGNPLPPTSTFLEVRRAVQDLGAEAFARRKKRMHALWQSFIYTARRHPFRFAMATAEAEAQLFFSAAGAVVLARRLRKHWQGQEMVGVLLRVGSRRASEFRRNADGQSPVNLNYTVSNETLASCAQQCNLKTIVTARVFIEKVKIQPPAKSFSLKTRQRMRGSANVPPLLCSKSLAIQVGREICRLRASGDSRRHRDDYFFQWLDR